jgi:hypothetical protein
MLRVQEDLAYPRRKLLRRAIERAFYVHETRRLPLPRKNGFQLGGRSVMVRDSNKSPHNESTIPKGWRLVLPTLFFFVCGALILASVASENGDGHRSLVYAGRGAGYLRRPG